MLLLLLLGCWSAWGTKDADSGVTGDDTALGTSPDGDGDGYTVEQGDCNDNDPSVAPDADDLVGDGIDQDCDGVDGRDADQDGYASVESGGEDCDDEDGSVFPGAQETENGFDDDCDGDVDEGTDAFDDDGDGYSEYQGDCDDCRSGLPPGAVRLASR